MERFGNEAERSNYGSWGDGTGKIWGKKCGNYERVKVLT
jgi:hypothetical protein